MSDIKEELRDIMERDSLSLTDLARATNYSKSTFSQWFNGKYPRSEEHIDKAARRFVELWKARESAAGAPLPFTLTSAAARIFEVLDLSHVDQELSIIYGEAGTGKSFAVREYARRNPEAILIETNLSYTPKNLLQEINMVLGLTTVGHLYTLFNEALRKIKNSGRLLIIDEAENLPYTSLEILRRLHDRSGIGICLVGMPKLIHNMRGKAGEYKQLYSRVGYITKIEGLREDDVKKIIDSVIPSANGLSQAFYEQSLHNARRLGMLYKRSKRVAEVNSKEIDKDIIQKASGMLLV